MKLLHPAILFISALAMSCSAGHDKGAWSGPATDLTDGPLRVSDNGRFVVHASGRPFIWLGDTAWELFGRADLDEIEYYLENRRAKGFTVIQAVILKELDEPGQAGKSGYAPLTDLDPARPDSSYFEWLDRALDLAESKGLYVALLPTWGDKVDPQWGAGPQIFDPENARIYGRWLGERYRTRPNIIWVVGGDRAGGGENYPVWNAMAEGIRSADSLHLMTYHPKGEHSSSMWFHNAPWLDFNMFQSGHAQQDFSIYRRLLYADLARYPVKPVLDGEPRYEQLPYNFDTSNRLFTAHDSRMAMYQSLLSGAFGHTYGANEVWQMYDHGREPVLGASIPWKEALELEGAGHILHARRLLESIDWTSRMPAPEILLSGSTDDGDMAVAAKGNGYAIVYLPYGRQVIIDPASGGLRGEVKLTWYDPRTGERIPGGKHTSDRAFSIRAPGEGEDNDWILIME